MSPWHWGHCEHPVQPRVAIIPITSYHHWSRVITCHHVSSPHHDLITDRTLMSRHPQSLRVRIIGHLGKRKIYRWKIPTEIFPYHAIHSWHWLWFFPWWHHELTGAVTIGDAAMHYTHYTEMHYTPGVTHPGLWSRISIKKVMIRADQTIPLFFKCNCHSFHET